MSDALDSPEDNPDGINPSLEDNDDPVVVPEGNILSEPDEQDPDSITLAQFVSELSIEFDEQCQVRHAVGAETYGSGAFLTNDTIEMALEELVDFANYVRYTYIKVRLLQERLRQTMSDASQGTSFIPTSKFMEGARSESSTDSAEGV